MILNVNNLILKHNIKLNNKHDLKFVFRWDKSFRIQRVNSMKDTYILKKMNEIYFERTYANNRLKQFKTRNVENSSTKQTEIHKMLNISSENSSNAMKKSNIVNKNVRIDDEIWNEVARNTVESLNADSQIFRNNITNDNLLNSKIWNIYAKVKFSIRYSNRLIEIENSLNNVERSTNTTAFATIDEILIEKE